VEKLRSFGCVGCGELDHLFARTDGSQCKHAFCQVQRNWWADAKNRKLTKTVSVESMPTKSETNKRFKGAEYTKLYEAATKKRGPDAAPYLGRPKHDKFRQGEASIHVINQQEGREVGSDASDIPGVSEVAERAKQAPDDAENNKKRMELINERGVYVDSASAEALCIFAVDLGIDELAAKEMGLHETCARVQAGDVDRARDQHRWGVRRHCNLHDGRNGTGFSLGPERRKTDHHVPDAANAVDGPATASATAGLGGGVAADAESASGKDAESVSGKGGVQPGVWNQGISNKSVLKPSVVVISATRHSPRAASVTLTDADRWEKQGDLLAHVPWDSGLATDGQRPAIQTMATGKTQSRRALPSVEHFVSCHPDSI
jgi:hypothetical protein